MGEQPHIDLHDEDLQADIELLAEVIDHVSDHLRHLTDEEIDDALGLDTAKSASTSEPTPTGRPQPLVQRGEEAGRLSAWVGTGARLDAGST